MKGLCTQARSRLAALTFYGVGVVILRSRRTMIGRAREGTLDGRSWPAFRESNDVPDAAWAHGAELSRPSDAASYVADADDWRG